MIHPVNQIGNVGSDKAISIGDLATEVRDILSPAKQVIFLGKNRDIGNFSRDLYVPNNDKMRKSLGVSEWTSLSEGIRRMVS